MRKFNVGIIGCGSISGNYLKHAAEVFSDYYAVTALGDLDVEKARAKAEKYGIETFGLPDTVYQNPSVDLIINLTVPKAHEEVTLKALECGKHVYSEKPLALDRGGIKRIMEAVKKAGKRVGCAPDSFLSAPMQTAKKAIEEDWIGAPIGVSAACAMRGNEYWRPDADFFYQKGAGPMMDMAAYYFNVLISLLGPIDSVMSMNKITFDERTVKVPPRRGEVIKVEVPTYVTTSFRFENGVIGTFVNSFDIWKSTQPFIEIYGEKGTLVLPDPNQYKGDVLLRRMKDSEWRVMPQFAEYSAYGRGIGVADMVRSIQTGQEHLANAELAYHVTDTILSVEEAAEKKQELRVESTVARPSGLYERQDSILWK